MKLKFDHTKPDTVFALGVKKERLDEMVKATQKIMVDKYPNGTKSRYLDVILQQAKTDAEAIAAVIVWNAIMEQMTLRSMQAEMEEKSSNIIMPKMNIIKP